MCARSRPTLLLLLLTRGCRCWERVRSGSEFKGIQPAAPASHFPSGAGGGWVGGDFSDGLAGGRRPGLQPQGPGTEGTEQPGWVLWLRAPCRLHPLWGGWGVGGGRERPSSQPLMNGMGTESRASSRKGSPSVLFSSWLLSSQLPCPVVPAPLHSPPPLALLPFPHIPKPFSLVSSCSSGSDNEADGAQTIGADVPTAESTAPSPCRQTLPLPPEILRADRWGPGRWLSSDLSSPSHF